MWPLPVKPTVCPLMKALSTAWQSHLQSSACTNLSEAGQLISFTAALARPFGKCPFAISAFCPPGLAGFAIQTRLRESELFNITPCLLRPFRISSEDAPGQGLSAVFSSLALWPCPAAQRGTGPQEHPGLSWAWERGCVGGVLGHTGLFTASWAM